MIEAIRDYGHGTSASSPMYTTDKGRGTYGYNSGASGTVAVAANKRVTHIHAKAGGLVAATIVINGGNTITIPTNTSITLFPNGNLVAPTVVFDSTASYLIEHVE